MKVRVRVRFRVRLRMKGRSEILGYRLGLKNFDIEKF